MTQIGQRSLDSPIPQLQFSFAMRTTRSSISADFLGGHEESNITTRSQAVHGPVGDPLLSMQMDFPDTTQSARSNQARSLPALIQHCPFS